MFGTGGDYLNTLKLIYGQLIIVFFGVAIFLSTNSYTQLSLLLVILSSLMLILWSKKISGNYTNMTIFFIAFGTLYGVSGPITVVWGEGLHHLFSTNYYTDEFLVSYSITNIGLVIGIILYNLIHPSEYINERNFTEVFEKKSKIFISGIMSVIIASLFELINLFRVGGFLTLFAGKAIYQSRISELSLTLPSTEFMVLGFALVGIYLGIIYAKKGKVNRIRLRILQFIICASPFLLIKIVLGQRGMLITLFMCILIGITYFRPLKKIKPKFIIILIVFYVFLSFLFANRSIVKLIPENPSFFMEMAFNKERLVSALNPGANEFGAAFGNYNEFYNKYDSSFTPKLGETYIKGLVIPIPSFLYPGTKPKQITYEFRDEFFASEASRGRIAGTGFSSILEAYMNFKYFGVLFIYLIIGYLLQKIDRYYRHKNLFFMIMYVALFSQTISFPRNAFGTIFGSMFLNAILILIVVVYLRTGESKSVKSKTFSFNAIER